jgi:hypothetical protein
MAVSRRGDCKGKGGREGKEEQGTGVGEGKAGARESEGTGNREQGLGK